MNIYSFPAIAAFVVNFSTAFIVFFGNTGSAVNRWASALILSFAIWNISEIFILASGTEQGATLAAQILYRIFFLMPAIYVALAYHFPKSYNKLATSVLFHVALFLFPAILLASSFPNFHIELIPFSGAGSVYYYRIILRQDFQSISLLTTFFVYLLWGTAVVIRKYRLLQTTTQKRRSHIFLLGGAAQFAFSVLALNQERVIPGTLYLYIASTLLSAGAGAIFATAALQGKIFKSKSSFRNGLAYSIASSIILAIYFLGVQAVTEGLLSYLRISSYAANALFVLVLVILIRPLEQRIHGAIENVTSKDINKYRRSMVGFSRDLSNYLSTSDLLKRVESFLLGQFNIQEIMIFLKDDDSTSFGEWKRNAGSVEIRTDEFIVSRLAQRRGPIEFYDVDRHKVGDILYSYLSSHKVRLLFPLFAEDDLFGILAISARKSGGNFSTEMIDAIMIFANEVATAFQRNRIIEEIRRQEQEEFRVRHLASLGQLTAGVAHEIRNPLNVMSASAQTLLKKQLTREEEKELKEFIVDEADRLNKILTDFLNLAKLGPPKYEHVSPEDILRRVQMAVMASAGEVNVHVSLDDAPPEIIVDRDLLYQLLLNLTMNAIDAVKERCKTNTHFRCSDGKVALTFKVDDGVLNLSVSDNGIGIPEESAQKIFDPFYTTKDTGTGLGLSISNNIAETLGGRIELESKPGRTVFSFTCMMKKDGG